MSAYILDGAMMDTKERAHQHLQRQLGFPAYYGKNLDAMYDCLTDMAGEIRLYHTAALRRGLQGYSEKLLRALKDARSDRLNIVLED